MNALATALVAATKASRDLKSLTPLVKSINRSSGQGKSPKRRKKRRSKGDRNRTTTSFGSYEGSMPSISNTISYNENPSVFYTTGLLGSGVATRTGNGPMTQLTSCILPIKAKTPGASAFYLRQPVGFLQQTGPGQSVAPGLIVFGNGSSSAGLPGVPYWGSSYFSNTNGGRFHMPLSPYQMCGQNSGVENILGAFNKYRYLSNLQIHVSGLGNSGDTGSYLLTYVDDPEVVIQSTAGSIWGTNTAMQFPTTVAASVWQNLSLSLPVDRSKFFYNYVTNANNPDDLRLALPGTLSIVPVNVAGGAGSSNSFTYAVIVMECEIELMGPQGNVYAFGADRKVGNRAPIDKSEPDYIPVRSPILSRNN